MWSNLVKIMKFLVLTFLFLMCACVASHAGGTVQDPETVIINLDYGNKIFMPSSPVACPAKIKNVDDKIKECIVDNVEHVWIKAI